MNRQQTKELLPIIQAFAEGKTIQSKWIDGTWNDIDNESISNIIRLKEYRQELRIKPEPKYRPFKNVEECWEEMQKHQPFGWIKGYYGHYLIKAIKDTKAVFGINNNWLDLDYIFENYKFIDGTPFGIKE